MHVEEKDHIQDLQNLLDITNEVDDGNNDWEMLDGVLCGSTALSISNQGSELSDIFAKLSEECGKTKRSGFAVIHIRF